MTINMRLAVNTTQMSRRCRHYIRNGDSHFKHDDLKIEINICLEFNNFIQLNR